jgi:hypothetical protein
VALNFNTAWCHGKHSRSPPNLPSPWVLKKGLFPDPALEANQLLGQVLIAVFTHELNKPEES